MGLLDHLPYRPCVGVMLLNRDGLVFVGRRIGRQPEHSDATHSWQMPQGGIDDGEAPLVAAKRELLEETNIRSVSLLKEASRWYDYDLPDAIITKSWKGRFKGQSQKWFAFRFEGDESEINIAKPGGGAHKAEFNAWRWVKMQELPDLIIPFKRKVYESVLQEFGDLVL